MEFTLAERIKLGVYPEGIVGWFFSMVHFAVVVSYVGIKAIKKSLGGA